MGTPTSVTAYGQEFDIWTRAAESANGISIGPLSKADAYGLRVRLYSARDRRRKENKKVYPEDSPQHGRSPWENIEVRMTRVPGGLDFTLTLTPRPNIQLEIKEL